MKESDLDIFKKQLKFYRKRAGYSQEQLAEQIGKSMTWIAQIESGGNLPSFATLLDICGALKVPMRYLFTDDEYFHGEKLIDKLDKLDRAELEAIFSMLDGLNKN